MRAPTVIANLASTREVQQSLLQRLEHADRWNPARLRPELLLSSGAIEGPHRPTPPLLRWWPSCCAAVRGYINRFRPTL